MLIVEFRETIFKLKLEIRFRELIFYSKLEI